MAHRTNYPQKLKKSRFVNVLKLKTWNNKIINTGNVAVTEMFLIAETKKGAQYNFGSGRAHVSTGLRKCCQFFWRIFALFSTLKESNTANFSIKKLYKCFFEN